ncbi:c2H2-type zinc-finger domain-containing protein [Ditylenchus destructor]|nr:c2H2-type zinc-finger domain-containing protein [Ditylenchus destructor]
MLADDDSRKVSLETSSLHLTISSSDEEEREKTDEEFNEHDAIEPAIQMRLRSSSNNSAANLIQKKQALPKNDRPRRSKLSSKRSNPKKTNGTEKLHKCDHCSYASAWKGNLNRHERTHTGEKPFKCNKCPYVSTQSGTLKEHMRIHTGEKPFNCSQCSYTSATKRCLNAHIRTHTGK